MTDSTDLRWTLGGEPPEAAHFPDADELKADDDQPTEQASHTGTDPNGRAIGPAEDHTEVKHAPGDPEPDQEPEQDVPEPEPEPEQPKRARRS